MGTFIIIVIGLLIIATLFDKFSKKNEPVKISLSPSENELYSESGQSRMSNKFSYLVEGIFPPDLNIRTVKDNKDHLIRKYETNNGVTTIEIVQKLNRLQIIWDFRHVIFGHHEYEKYFDSNMPQNEILNIFLDDMEKINKENFI